MKVFFGKVKDWIKKHKKLVIFLIVLLVIGGLVLFIRHQVKKAQEMLNDMVNSGEVVEIERRSLVESRSATGSITSVDSESVVANVTGVKVLKVNYEVGDYVKEGDVICELDSENIETSLNNAKANLEAGDKKTDSDLAISKRMLNESKDTRNVQVERDYEDAQLRYNDYQNALDDLDKAQQDYDAAEERYRWRADEYNRFLEDNPDLDEFQINSDPHGSFYKSNYDAAKKEKESMETALENARRNADKALETYNNLIRSYEDHIKNNDSTIMSKNDALNTSRVNSTISGLNEKQQIEQYEKQLAECTVKAPISGVLTSVNVKEGDIYSGGSAVCVVEDDTSYEITTEIDEYDIPKIKVGQKVVFKTNGTGEEEFEGRVKEIAPRSTKTVGANGNVVQSGSVTYKVTIEIISECPDFRMDMTAKLSIILNEKDDVLTVPYDAVQIDEDGRFYIEKAPEETDIKAVAAKVNAEDPSENRIYVEKGIESDYYIEVIGEGVKEGVKIVVPNSGGMDEFMQLMIDSGAMGGM